MKGNELKDQDAAPDHEALVNQKVLDFVESISSTYKLEKKDAVLRRGEHLLIAASTDMSIIVDTYRELIVIACMKPLSIEGAFTSINVNISYEIIEFVKEEILLPVVLKQIDRIIKG